ncbi:preQ(1) synthase [Candidatus Margulisiibacteriota bacterium]
MPKAEGKKFQFDPPDKIKTNFLETFPYKGEKQHIVYETQEFSCVCPFSGLPDFGKLTIEYIPAQKCLELKSLKYYLVSFRNIGIYQEAVTNRIFQDLSKFLKPTHLKIQTKYNTRGGIDAVCTIESS